MAHNALLEILVLLAASVVLVALFRRINLPPILAYLLAGAALGPHGFRLVADTQDTRFLAEFGVVFLLFTLGLEFSLPRLIALRREVLGLGGAQVLFTAALASLGAWALGMTPAAAFVIGGVLAMSSTAIVIKQLTEQLELNSQHGRSAVGILLFQDVAVLPFLIAIPVLGGGGGDVASELGLALVKGTLVVVAMLAGGRWLLRPLFHEIASLRSPELFTLTALLFTLAAAAASYAAGLSMALGAFLAGMMLGETEFRHQVEADIRPFRDVLLGLFFITVGMLLNVERLPAILPWVIVLLVALVVLKTVSIAVISVLMGRAQGVGIRTGLVLAQGGEFGFALLSLAVAFGILDPASMQVVLATVILSMAVTPFLVRYNGAIARLLFAESDQQNRGKTVREVAASASHLDRHVIICGYGRVGQSIARFVEHEEMGYIALDMDPVRVRDARAAGEPVSYGDSTHREILEAAGLHRARVLVISYDDAEASMKIIQQARAMGITIPILVRTRDDSNLDRLQKAGATEVVPETLEASLMLASHLLLLLGAPVSRVVRQVQQVRTNRYQMLRVYFHGEETEPLGQPGGFRERLYTVSLPERAFAVGRTLGEVNLGERGVMVTAVRRGGIRGSHPHAEMRLQSGDALVLYGAPEDLERAEARLLGG
jgi:CPA2 family monovalent cation:H+ antiporter-2